MAKSIFAKSPVEIATERANAKMRGIASVLNTPRNERGAPLTFDAIARQTQVPQNIIEAAVEMSGASDGREVEFAQAFAAAVGEKIAAGMKVGDAVRSVLPKNQDAANALLQLAVQKVGGAQPAEPADGQTAEPSAEKSMLRDAADVGIVTAGGATKGVGLGISGFGRMIDQNLVSPGARYNGKMEIGPDGTPRLKVEENLETTPLTKASERLGEAVYTAGERIQGVAGEDTRKAQQDSWFTGDIRDPSTWGLPKNPTVKGVLANIGDVLGTMAPIVIASVIAKDPKVAAGLGMAIGGAQAGGEGAQEAKQKVEEAAVDVDESGVSRLERESPLYRSLIASGRSPDKAVAMTAEAAARSASELQAIVGGLGGAVTGRLLHGPIAALAGRGAAARIGGQTALGALEEGAQEATETMAANFETKRTTGLDIDIGDGTLNDFIMGAVAGGGAAAVGGVRRDNGARLGAEMGKALDTADAQPPAAPVHDMANTMFVDDAGNPVDPPKAKAPAGPISAAAAAAPDMPDAPAPVLPGLPEGARVRVEIPDGEPIEATFRSEDENGVTLEADGAPFTVPRDEIEAGDVSIIPADPLSQAKAQAAATPLQMPDIPEQSPFSDQIRFDVSTAIKHEIDLANRRGNGMMRGLSVSDATVQNAVKAGADAALSGAQTPPVYDDGNLSQAAKVGFGLALNKAKTLAVPRGLPSGASAVSQGGETRRRKQRIPFHRRKRPFTTLIIDRVGQIDPNGPFAAELKHAGVTPQTAPGLFRKGGRKSLDNIPAPEFSEYAGIIGVADDGLYLNEQDVIDAIVRENAGEPMLPIADQEIADAEAAEAEIEELKANGIAVDEDGTETISADDAPGIIPPFDPVAAEFDGGEDWRMARARDVDAAIRAVEQEAGVDLHPSEREQVAKRLFDLGGDAEAAVWWQLDQEPEQYAEQQPTADNEIPWGNEDPGKAASEPVVSRTGGEESRAEVRPGDERSERKQADEGRRSAADEDAARPASEARRQDDVKESPSGFTFKLADRLETRDQRIMARWRDSSAGEVLAQIDGVIRRAEDQMRRKWHDIRAYDDAGFDDDGKWNQEAGLIGEGVSIAKRIIADMRKAKSGDLPFPSRDENTGEYESDGSAISDALDWLTNAEANGIQIDPFDAAEAQGTGDTKPMPDAEIFQAPAKTVAFTPLAKNGPFISQDEADARIAHWKQVAKDIGRSGVNSGKAVISLFDYTGEWSQPWQDAGYAVIRHDIKHGSDVLADSWIYERIEEARAKGVEIVGVLSACPCTTFTGSGARWWADLHDKESPEAVEKVFGKRALLSGAKSPLEYNVMLYEATREVVAKAAPTRFHVLENPVGRIQEVTSLTKPTLRFHPSNFGNPYTKQTQLFGPMETDLPLANVKPVEGSKMQSKLRGNDPLSKEARSTTPEGFAYAFFMANDPEARKRKDESARRVLATEQTPEGEQTLIPGVAPLTDKARAEARMKQPKRGGDAPVDFGLFDEGARKQGDLFDAPGQQAIPIDDARQVQKKRDAREAGRKAGRAGEPRKAPDFLGDELGAEWLAGYGEALAEQSVPRADFSPATMEMVGRLGDGVAALPTRINDGRVAVMYDKDTASIQWGKIKDGRHQKTIQLKRTGDGGWGIEWATDRFGGRQLVHPRAGEKIAKEYVIAAHLKEAIETFPELARKDASYSPQTSQERKDWADRLEPGYTLRGPGEPHPVDPGETIDKGEWIVVNPEGGVHAYGETPQEAVETHLNYRDQEREFARIDADEQARKDAAPRPNMTQLTDLHGFSKKDGVFRRSWKKDGDTTYNYIVREVWNGNRGRWELRVKRATRLDAVGPLGKITNPPDKDLGTFTATGAALKAMWADGLPTLPDSGINEIDDAKIARVAALYGGEYTAKVLREEVAKHGWKKLAFAFQIDEGNGRYHYRWFDGTGTAIGTRGSKTLKQPPALQRGEFRDALSAYAKVRQGFDFAKVLSGAENGAALDERPEKSQKPGSYGANNKLVSAERAAELRERLKAKLRDQLNAGIDPEIMAIGAELAVFHIEAGARRFVDLAKAIADDLGTTPAKLRPYLRSWYNGARDMMEDHGLSIDGMDDADAVRDALRSGALDAGEQVSGMDPANAEQGDVNKDERAALTSLFHESLRAGDEFPTITRVRKLAAERLGRMLSDADLKMIEEAFEAAIVRHARRVAQASSDPVSAYDELVRAYQAQPKLAQRTSTSIEQQAYSTPAPLAYLASRLAGIDAYTNVYEPTAGNGMLLIEAENHKITANELNPDRFSQLRREYPGAKLTNEDAMSVTQPSGQDVVIANPPFGKVKDAGNNTVQFPMADISTTEIDHAIAFRALEAMKDDGRAVLILGGHQGDATRRRDKYRGSAPRKFFKRLYDTYNVTEHFTVDGKLYERQGAGWPVDVIVIEGRKPSEKVYPMGEAPAVYSSWEQLRERLDGTKDNLDPRGERGLHSRGTLAEADSAPDQEQLRRTADDKAGTPDEDGTGIGSRPDSGGGAVPVGLGSPERQGQHADPGTGLADGGVQRDLAQQDSGDANMAGSAGSDQGRPGREGGAAIGDVAGVSARTVSVAPRQKPKRENTEKETAFQVQYEPRSAAQFAVGTLVPRNMQDAAARALDSLERRVGNIDAFVAEKLGYDLDEMLGTPDRPGRFSAEQIDALALAIDNIEAGKGFIIGDQTGVGKGRINAGLIRYAIRNGKLPVFFTVKPGLYGDMIRDLRDIGERHPEDYVFVTNDGLRGGDAIPLSDDPADRLLSLPKSKNRAAIRKIATDGILPPGKKVIFTTYDQMTTQKGNVTDRMRAIEAIAPNAFFILDESHEAGGTGSGSRKKKANAPEPRSVFIRKILRASQNGAFFSSATFAKNPAVMSLYFKTNISEAVPNIENLEDVVEKGGVPLQQVISASLVEDGQYLRRERTYEGIQMNLEQMTTDPVLARDAATSLREIFALDQNVMSDVRDAFIDAELSMGGDVAMDGAVGSTGAQSTTFSSIMHNAVSQVLLAIKADAVVDAAIAAYERGEKPIIALSNTNASILEDYASEMGIRPGDEFNIPFNEILRRYIQRLRRITIRIDEQTKEHIHLSDGDIRAYGGAAALDEVKRVEAFIERADFGGMPASPIDYLRDRLEENGIRTGEVTGRGKIIRNGILETRDSSAAANKRAMNAYNNGDLDALIINRSGATGFSLHATEKNDGKVRHMFILQPDPNIDTFMQMLGRINRTGQIKLPKYTIAVSDLAVEKRPAAVLMRKMASLNANTTASKKSAVSLDNVTDFMNRYGDEVVLDYLRENPELAAITGIAIPARKSEATGIAAKFTGKLAILDPDTVARIFDDIEAAYTAYIKELDAMGQNALEAKVLDLGARTINRTVISQGQNPESAFGGDTVLEDVDVKVIGKPMTPDQVREQIDKVLGGNREYEWLQGQIQRIDELAAASLADLEKMRPTLKDRLSKAKTDKQKDKAADAIRRLDKRTSEHEKKIDQVKNMVRDFRPGRPVIVQVRKGGETVDSVYGVTLGMDLSRLEKNPTALSRAQVRIALASPARELRVPASRFDGGDAPYEIVNANESSVWRAFEDGQKEAREQRQIVTGNIIAGIEKFGKGQIVMFTRDGGTTDRGILMPKDFDAQKEIEKQPVSFSELDHAIRFVNEAGTMDAPGLLKTSDGVLTVQRTHDGYALAIRRKGGKPYILSPAVRQLVGDFTSRSGDYRKAIAKGQLRPILEVYRDTLGAEFVADNHKDAARAITGETLPDFGGGTAEMRAPSTIIVRGNELGEWTEISDLRSKAFEYYRNNVAGLTVTNEATGWKVRFARGKAARKVTRGKGEAILNAIPHLPSIIRQARLVESMDDNRGRPNIRKIHAFETLVSVDGSGPVTMRAYIRETTDGRFFYDLTGNVGAGRSVPPKGIAETALAPALEGSADAVNLSFTEPKDKPAPAGWGLVEPDTGVTDSEIAQIAGDVQAEMRASGLSGKVTAKVVRKITDMTAKTQAVYRRGRGEIEVRADAVSGPVGTLRHELVHVLRDEALWGRPYGLFTRDEWQGLVREARKDKAAMVELHKRYPDLDSTALMEEAVAEMYRRWREGSWDGAGPAQTALGKIRAFFEAIANALRGRGFQTAARTMQKIADGGIAGRGDPNQTGPGGGESPGRVREMRAPNFTRGPSVKAASVAAGERKIVSDMLTQAMAGKNGANLLALVPGRALLDELGGRIPALGTYLRLKEKMDTLRNRKHEEMDRIAQEWRKLLKSDPDENRKMMDLMHDSTIAGQDPSKPFVQVSEVRDGDLVKKYGKRHPIGREAWKRIQSDKQRRIDYDALRARYMALPPSFRKMYVTVRDAYEKMGREFEQAVEKNAEKALGLAVRRAERAHKRELERIRDDGLTGAERDEAIARADARLKTVKKQAAWSKVARIAALRKRFEDNRLSGPYFPLARFGDFFVTLRDMNGGVVSFSTFESRRKQRAFAEEMRSQGYTVETGVLSRTTSRDLVDPGFVADIENLLNEINADASVMDAVWQRWLQTLPDMSLRRNRLHRKGTRGYSADAFRAFGHQMFHGAHQLARLTYGIDMGEAIEVAREEAKSSSDPERAGLVVEEVNRRHEYVMNPQGSAWAQNLTSSAFVYYLAITPAAAAVNLTQTTVVGVPILGAWWGKGGIARAATEIARASRDFVSGGFDAAKGKSLTADERKALADAYDRGTIDKSESHDLAGVGETGAEYSPVRTKVMGVISFLFHHAERANREITFLAGYRMARAKGLGHDAAVEKAADLTWKSHFDYQNTSRPRLMQNDYLRVAMVFRNFQINMLWRLFRDAHQSLAGESPAVRAEARRQLIGISAQMLLHGGIKGVWGYSIIKALVGMFFPGGGDDAEKELEKAMLALLPKDVAGAFLNGIPGHLLGIDLRARVGMPDLWFRSPDRVLEGEDEFNYWMQELIGASAGMVKNMFVGGSRIAKGIRDDEPMTAWRGIETMMPKAIRDQMRAIRYAMDGAETFNGDPIIDEFKVGELIAQALGFTPARLAERYEKNSRLKNAEKRILDRRSSIMRRAGKAAISGRGIPQSVLDDIRAYNRDNPDYPITSDSLRRSIIGRMKASQRNEFGVQINPRLSRRLRAEEAPLIYSD